MRLMPPPGPERRRALAGLAIAAAALAAFVWYPRHVPTEPASAASNSQARGQGPSGAASGALPSALGFDKIEPVPEAQPTERNPFRFGVRPPPPAPPQPVAPAPVAPPPTPADVGPPRIPLTLIGLTEARFPSGGQQRRLATLKDPSGTLFHGFEGDELDGRYRLLKVGLQSVVISYLDGTGQITLAIR
jgi:type IV secretory pathway VirB10-like protein